MDEEELAELGKRLGSPEDYDLDEAVPVDRTQRLAPSVMARTLREMSEWTVQELSERCFLEQAVIVDIERGDLELDVAHARALARAFRVHPSVILFSDWERDSVAL